MRRSGSVTAVRPVLLSRRPELGAKGLIGCPIRWWYSAERWPDGWSPLLRIGENWGVLDVGVPKLAELDRMSHSVWLSTYSCNACVTYTFYHILCELIHYVISFHIAGLLWESVELSSVAFRDGAVLCVAGEAARLDSLAGGEGVQQPGAEQPERTLLPRPDRCKYQTRTRSYNTDAMDGMQRCAE